MSSAALAFDQDKAAFNLLYAQPWWRRLQAERSFNLAMALVRLRA